MIKVRYRTFETNSSSTHSLVICTEEEYEKFKNGEMLFDYNKLINRDSIECKCEDGEEECDCYEDYDTYKSFFSDRYLETFEKEYVTKSGDKIVIFGKYGYDG